MGYELTSLQEYPKTDVRPDSPVLHGAEGLLVGDVVHQDEAHGSTVVCSGDGPVALLARRILHRDTGDGAPPLAFPDCSHAAGARRRGCDAAQHNS